MVDEFIKYICEILKIDAPVVKINRNKMATESTLACIENGIVYLKTKQPSLDLLFAISHELRHIWQIKTDQEFYFKNYKTSQEIDDIDVYNQQVAELDANAFGYMIMSANYGVEPLFNGLSKETVQMIKEYTRRWQN